MVMRSTPWVMHQLSHNWTPLFERLSISLDRAKLWYREVTSSQYCSQPPWHSLIDSLTTLDPTIKDSSLIFKPRFALLPMVVQERLLQFMLSEDSCIPDGAVHELLRVVLDHISENTTLCNLAEKLCALSQFVRPSNLPVEPYMSTNVCYSVMDISPENVIIIDDDSESDTDPAPKQSRLEMATVAVRNQPILEMATAVSKKPGFESATSAVSNQPGLEVVLVDGTKQEGTDFLDREANASPPGILTQWAGSQSVSFIDNFDNNGVVAVDTDNIIAFASALKDTWHSCVSSEIPDCLQDITHLSAEEMEKLCTFAEFEGMSDDSVYLACQHMGTLCGSISFCNISCFLSMSLKLKVSKLSQNASRKLTSAIMLMAGKYPKQLVETVIIPCLLVSDINSYQCDIITKLLKENTDHSLCSNLLHDIVKHEFTITESNICVFQAILESGCELTESDITQFVSVCSKSAGALANSLKFGKVLLAIISHHGNKIQEILTELENIVSKNRTVLKKKISSLLIAFNK
ncbi:uncharacterized protein LOC127843214 isoform X2 [Dreissena polymorpha]|uniref:Fanconi Anaemia group E protein C-terminal domain-containing protein n=2 Tax=Dreissena polymorpha TaxID=45954 RepID=A0A9D4N4U9_DREPO|nr:uncharacterized protein LOC127843214 isoform X2 [Dreissena polymorpha]XP_052229049.1 uncharacterized protein LOC127843214 isoform X2 [Dreissena polymorpha]XP_052229051.1 uncharacterized protein LOC127843214 isoform X2 [Dreissena polymorpha]KAH3887314.1 hypothetical protein DPMN_011329 [Dreissena polymorpha]